MEKWFRVTASLRVAFEDGKTKVTKKSILIRAVSLTEIESVALEIFRGFTVYPESILIEEAKVQGIEKVLCNPSFNCVESHVIGKAKYIEFTFNEESYDNIYAAKVVFFALDEKSGNLKPASKVDYITPSESIKDATEDIRKSLSDCVTDWKILGCKEVNYSSIVVVDSFGLMMLEGAGMIEEATSIKNEKR